MTSGRSTRRRATTIAFARSGTRPMSASWSSSPRSKTPVRRPSSSTGYCTESARQPAERPSVPAGVSTLRAAVRRGGYGLRIGRPLESLRFCSCGQCTGGSARGALAPPYGGAPDMFELDQAATRDDDAFDPEDLGRNPSRAPTLQDVIDARLSRRGVLRGLAVAAVAGAAPLTAVGRALAQARSGVSSLAFSEVPHGLDDKLHVAPGYDARVLIRWGDRVLKEAPEFDIAKQTGAAQVGQFGYNADFIAYMPLPLGSRNSTHGLLCVNHEYTNTELMFAGFKQPHNGKTGLTREQAEVDMAAHGLSVVEISKNGNRWRVVEDSKYNRRFTLNETAYRLTGPAAGDKRMQTSGDPSGRLAYGTLNNCAGGVTP